ncbi:casein kinase I-like protein HRR25 [Enteropsectra breve]|nr:casein kinase I-like protein HRR25 [Enteropsectra breve]
MASELKHIKINSKIAQGAFGEVYYGEDESTGTKLAVKVEKKAVGLQLKHEFAVYRRLAGPNTPHVYEFGKVLIKDTYVSCMTMEVLGPSLEKVFVKMGRFFTMKTILMIGKRCLQRIEHLHTKHLLHRDIKPDNFVVDQTESKIYLIDYGLAKEYRNPQTLIHRPYRDDKNLTGTARYSSVNTHRGIEQSRRDDLESLGYIMVYFAKGKLPWQGLKAETKYEKYAKIAKVKAETPLEVLCEGLPPIFEYMTEIRRLEYESQPDYKKMYAILENGLRTEGQRDDSCFDWLPLTYQST